MANNANFNRTLRGAILRKLRMRLVTDAIVNRDLVRGSFEEPEDTVEVKTLGDVSVEDYNGSLPNAQDIAVNNDPITADHKKAFAFKAPADDSASEIADLFAQEGVSELLKAAQKYVFGLYSDANLQVDYDPSSDSLPDKISDVSVKMDNAEAPDSGRWLVLPPTEVQEISDDVMERETDLGDEAVAAGYQGMYKGFNIFKAPAGHFSDGSTYRHAMAGIPTSLAYSDAVLNVRNIPSTDFSGNQIDGLHVAGGAMIRQDQTVDLRINIA